MASPSPLRIFIFDSARLRSHLFFRFLSTHDAFAPIYHPFLSAAMFGPEELTQHLKRPNAQLDDWTNNHTLPGYDATFDSDRAAFVTDLEHAEERGKLPIANEHWFNVVRKDQVLDLLRDPSYQAPDLGQNPTHIPDDLFTTITPVILIRHPALVVDSMYRSCRAIGRPDKIEEEHFDLLCASRPLRVLYDYFTAQGRRPIVVDGEDLLWRTDEISEGICARLGHGVEADGLSETWLPTSQSEIAKMNQFAYMFTKDIHDSEGIRRPDVKVCARYINIFTGVIADYVTSLLIRTSRLSTRNGRRNMAKKLQSI
jgi:hypothetical protein